MFANKPNEIIAQVRRVMIHPCECKYYFDAKNWPKVKTAGEIEKQFMTQDFVFGICRKFTLACVAIMRSKGIPARSRCGFANYLTKEKYEDHWVVEYMESGFWRTADAQTMMFDLRVGQFINGAIAWKLVRDLHFDPSLFGFSGHEELNASGIHYIIGNMLRDLSGLQKCELNYADTAKIRATRIENIPPKKLETYDKIADIIIRGDEKEIMSINLAELLA